LARDASVPAWDAFIEALSPQAGERILDVGAGDCSKAARVYQGANGAEVFAVDPNEKRISLARRNHPEIKSRVASAESLPFSDAYFDRAYSTMALHHFSDLGRALEEIARVLKPGGSYVVVEVEPRSFNGRLFRFFGKLSGEKMQIMTQGQLVALIGGGKQFTVLGATNMGSSYLVQLKRS